MNNWQHYRFIVTTAAETITFSITADITNFMPSMCLEGLVIKTYMTSISVQMHNVVRSAGLGRLY